jgi:hypothetical protein
MKKNLKIVLCVVICLQVLVFVFGFIDYTRFVDNKEPIFCFKRAIYDYDDGSVKENVCFGYKIYNYDRKLIQKLTFVPIWQKMDE